MTPSDDTAVFVSGVGTTAFAPAITDRTAMALQLEAAIAAIRDAGLGREDIDGVITHGSGRRPGENPRGHIELTEKLGLFHKVLCLGVPAGGGCPGLSLLLARSAIRMGRCRNVLLVHGTASGAGEPRGAREDEAQPPGHSESYEAPYGPRSATYLAALARRHMHEHGTTPEQLAAVAVASRRHASLNPDAIARSPIDIGDVLRSEPVSRPLHALDCALRSDGAAAMVISAPRQSALAHRPVRVAGLGHASGAYFTGSLARSGGADHLPLVRRTGRLAAGQAFAEAGLSPARMAFAQLSDDATIAPIVQLEDFGFCAPGAGGSFAAGGSIELGGALPVNTHGGHLSCNHEPAGYLHWIEAVRQLRGECGPRQVDGAEAGLVSSTAGALGVYGAVGVLTGA